ncbi:MAG: hypothetical protein LBK61_01180 [Spirochaetaceae bacterium]|nr:hypothetical protein [Spirochaetaceae bacterium]
MNERRYLPSGEGELTVTATCRGGEAEAAQHERAAASPYGGVNDADSSQQ